MLTHIGLKVRPSHLRAPHSFRKRQHTGSMGTRSNSKCALPRSSLKHSTCTFSPSIKYIPSPKIYTPPEAGQEEQDPHFLLAIYTFVEDNAKVHVPKAGLGFMLAWYPPKDNPWLKDSDVASVYLSARSKVDTSRVVTFTRAVNSKDGYSTIIKDERRLQGESLVMASLYL